MVIMSSIFFSSKINNNRFFRTDVNKSISIIAVASLMLITSLFSFNSNVFAETINDHGHPHTLKEELIDYKPGEQIICPNPDHVLVLRPNTQWACVYPETAQHLKWDLVSFPEFEPQKITTYVFAHDNYHNVSYQISDGDVDSIKFMLDFYSLIIKITPSSEGELILTIPTGENGLFKDYCEENNMYSDTEHFMILVDGEEVEHESSEINTDLKNVKLDYLSDTKIIEIIYACLV